ncbi:MAG: DUF4097 family beta strand repeat-containing protein [Coriobacteriaceae bacterium]|nr:DUF4097 family beta strand repeat-containing protein [Coriobacteriaceae bacterium]MDO4437733.1 DUF4097 family beta strand repeat-containing protein [Coriobacteriaceae bacterium]
MRKSSKVVLVTAAAFICAGTLLMGGAWASAGFDLAKLSTVDYDWKRNERTLESEESAPHGRIVVRSDFENVRFEQAAGDAIEIEYWTGNAQDIDIEGENGVLTLNVTSKPVDGVMLDLSPAEAGGVQDTTTVVRVPSTFAGAIEIESDAGEVFIEDLHELAEVSISNLNGDTVLNDVSAKKLSADHQSSDAMLSNVTTDELTVSNENGEVSLSGISTRTAEVASTNGSIILANVTASETLTCESENGEITAQNLDAAETEVESENGDVSLSYLGSENDYRIDAYSEAGDVDTPRGNFDASRIVHVEAINGSIQIGFTGSR